MSMVEAYPMKGGDDDSSYSKNSSFQREVIDNARSLIDETIARNLNIKDLIFGSSSSFDIADLGCSVGPNTFICTENIIEAVKYKYQSQVLASSIPAFRVFFNDLVLNDFNTLFRSLPPKREYFAARMPGPFHGRLFRSSSLHLMHSSTSLHWLSQVPEEILKSNSPAWNKGRIFYTHASDEVCKAYATQFEKDMEIFLDARAKELVVSGIILIMVPTIRDGISHSCEYFNVSFDLLGSSLMDMAREGLVREVQVDLFNLPIYISSAKEMTELVKRNSCFIIERIELFKAFSAIDVMTNGKTLTKHWRAALEGIISKHFGGGIIDEFFDRFLEKMQEFSSQVQASLTEVFQVFLALKRV